MTSKMNKQVLSILVDNHSGVLARVASLFCQRGFNIDSLTVSNTDNPEISRITIVTEGDKQVLEQIIKQTGKLEETRAVVHLKNEDSLFRELLLVKIAADHRVRREVCSICEIYRAKIVDLTVTSMIVELTGSPSKIDGFMEMMKEYQILEMCRTGVTALARGDVSHGIKSK